MGEHISIDIGGAIATITLDRPERRNALTLAMLRDLEAAAGTVAASEARVVILRGVGKGFSAGMDLATFADGPLMGADPDRRYDAAHLGRAAVDALASIPQVSIASLHGHVVGGGVVLAAACDLRIADEPTAFVIPEIDVGIPLAWGGLERLVAEIGPARTKEIVMTGRRFSAAEAHAWGLVNTVVPEGGSLEAAMDLAGIIASKARFPITTTKRHVAEIVAGDTSRDDAIGLVAAIEDPEASARRVAYLERFTT
jgi:enoyl-CoA hydratase/carnithine racemase